VGSENALSPKSKPSENLIFGLLVVQKKKRGLKTNCWKISRKSEIKSYDRGQPISQTDSRRFEIRNFESEKWVSILSFFLSLKIIPIILRVLASLNDELEIDLEL
jgi:hypothetical protein